MRPGWISAGGLLLLAVALALGCLSVAVPRPTDMDHVLALNNHGVGFMERFDYERAIPLFEQVVRLAPGWLPGRVNLGIALLNAGGTTNPAQLRATRAVFDEVLRIDPDNAHAHHCLGLLLMYQKDPGEAIHHFRAATRAAPDDAAPWFFLGLLVTDDAIRQDCVRRALELDPYHLGALYQNALLQSRTDPDRGRRLLETFEALKRAEWGNPSALKYGEMGALSEVIAPHGGEGRAPRAGVFDSRIPVVRLAPGAAWARPAELGAGATGELWQDIRKRFGEAVVVLDFDGDGRSDLFLAGAVVEKGQVRDLLLRNEGEAFVDVTAQAGLASPHATLGVAVGDFDNDGRPDLLLTGIVGQKLYRNAGAGQFEDVTSRAGLDTVQGVCLGAAWVDLDQDGDLDLVLAQYAPSADDALRALGGKPATAGRLVVFLNIGEAPPADGPSNPPPLTCRFRRADALPVPGLTGHFHGVVVGDFDGDHDVDLIALADGRPPVLVVNDRLLRFRAIDLPGLPRSTTGGLVLDAAHAGRSDLFLAGPSPRLWPGLRRPVGNGLRAVPGSAGMVRCPPLKQAHAVDLDLDGWTDVVGLSEAGDIILLAGGRRRLTPWHCWGGLGSVRGMAVMIDGTRPVIVLKGENWLRLGRPAPAAGQALIVHLTGRRGVEPGGMSIRCNADAIGTRVIAQAGDVWTGIENATLSAGPGQSRPPLVLGLGRHPRADVVRLRWPDGTWQAELDQAGVARIRQANRKTTSCPVLFTWDGSRFRFVTDFLGAGSLGELLPDGSTRPARGEESLKLEADQLKPRAGNYLLDIAEPMDEITYLDHLQLVAVDHPPRTHVYPDERFPAGGPAPTQALIAFDRVIEPARAVDHRGRDVKALLRQRDRDMVDTFARRSWLGFAEEHWVELDFAGQLAGFGPGDRLFLCLAGWTDYPYPESIWAAHQAGVAMLPPVLERLGNDGCWHKIADAGFPAGLPRVMLVEVTGLLVGPSCRLRLRTNLQIAWDQAFIAAGCREVDGVPLEVSRARLVPCGIHHEFTPDGRAPTEYAHDRFDRVPVLRLAGRLTRYGDVTELLHHRDDRFVLFGPGDLLRVAFDAGALPPLRPGWKRSFVLRTAGWCKDTAPFTATGGVVEPLPFRAMRRYPPGSDERPPDTAAHRADRERYHTREVRTAHIPDP